MKTLNFTIDIDQYSVDHIDEIHLKYHINTFDFPMLHTHKDYWSAFDAIAARIALAEE